MISLLESLGVVCVVETAHWPQLARCENAWLRGHIAWAEAML